MDQVGNGGNETAVGRLAALPGRELQAALATLDDRDLSGTQLALVVQAQARLLARVQAAMAATTNAFVHCPPSSPLPTASVEAVEEFACDELALLLHVAPMTGKNLVLKPSTWSNVTRGCGPRCRMG